jgi:uncharacterized membrane protein YgdD (TMEM256/DUF423 family)
MNRPLLLIASLLGALSVILGAFAAHALKEIFPAESMTIFETGVRYQFYHVFAIFIAAFLSGSNPSIKYFKWAASCFLLGIVLFCGSLYALAAIKANGISGLGAVGIVTPLGGIFFIAGWLLLFFGVYKLQKK